MPETTISDTNDLQIIGGVFSDRQDAERAVIAFHQLGIPDKDIQIVVQVEELEREELPGLPAKKGHQEAMIDRGFAPSQAVHYDKQIRAGKTMIAIHNVFASRPVIDVFNQNRADLNPDGTRNVRQDVIGMTAGAAITATALGTAGAAIGPAGVVAGVAAGTVVGGALGPAAGKIIEHSKYPARVR